jgi:hypothetical protein
LRASFSAAKRSTGELNLTKDVWSFGTQIIDKMAAMAPTIKSVTVSNRPEPKSLHAVHDKKITEIAAAVAATLVIDLKSRSRMLFFGVAHNGCLFLVMIARPDALSKHGAALLVCDDRI